MDLFDKRASETPVRKPLTVQAAIGDPWPLPISWNMVGDPWPHSTVRAMAGDPWPISTAGVLQILHTTTCGLQGQSVCG